MNTDHQAQPTDEGEENIDDTSFSDNDEFHAGQRDETFAGSNEHEALRPEVITESDEEGNPSMSSSHRLTNANTYRGGASGNRSRVHQVSDFTDDQ